MIISESFHISINKLSDLYSEHFGYEWRAELLIFGQVVDTAEFYAFDFYEALKEAKYIFGYKLYKIFKESINEND